MLPKRYISHIVWVEDEHAQETHASAISFQEIGGEWVWKEENERALSISNAKRVPLFPNDKAPNK